MAFDDEIIAGVAEIFEELPPVTATFEFVDRSLFDKASGELPADAKSTEVLTVSPLVPITQTQQSEYGFQEAMTVFIVQHTEFTALDPVRLPTLATSITVNGYKWGVEKVVELTPGQNTPAAWMIGVTR